MTARWFEIDRWLTEHHVRIGPPRVSQTVGGTHATGSYHYTPYQTARDYGDLDSDVDAVWQLLLPHAIGDNAPLVELFGPRGLYKRGQRIHNDALQHQHADHVHAALHPERSLPEPPPQQEELTVADIADIHAALDDIRRRVLAMHEGDWGEKSDKYPLGDLAWLDNHLDKQLAPIRRAIEAVRAEVAALKG